MVESVLPSRTAQVGTLQQIRHRRRVERRQVVAGCQVLEGKRIAVVGGGPGGMMAAARVASLGANVDVYERYSEEKTHPEFSRSQRAGWLIMLGTGITKALESAGISPDLGAPSRFEGGRMVDENGTKFLGPWTSNGKDGLISSASSKPQSASRTAIADHIRRECARAYGSQVTVHDGYTLTGGDPAAGRLVFEGPHEEEVVVDADMVVGADGVNSLTRRLMQEHDPELTVKTDLCYSKTLPVFISSCGGPTKWGDYPAPSGEPSSPGVPAGVDSLSGATLHIFYPATKATKRDSVCLGTFSGLGGEHTSATLNMSPEWWATPRSEEEVLQWLIEAFPAAPLVWLQESAAAAAKVIAGDQSCLRQHKFLELSKLNSGRAVLVGDAGHAMSPHLGMGCNSALSDGAALGDAVLAVNGDLAAAPAEFSASRLPEVKALVRLTRDRCIRVTYSMHRNLRQYLAALPFTIAYEASDSTNGLPGWLRPGAAEFTLQSGGSAQEVEAAFMRYGRAVLGGAAAVAFIIAVGIVKAASLIAA